MEKRCILCKEVYIESKNIGSLSCYFHPLTINFDRRGKNYGRHHYECCGATNMIQDHTHFESTRPKGCVRIDHISSKEELETVLNKPYIITTMDYFESKLAEHSHHEAIHRITNNSMLQQRFEISVPTMNPFYINIRKKYNKIHKLNNNSVEWFKNNNEPTSSLYTYDVTPLNRNAKAELLDEEKFKPIVIVKRISSRFDKTKEREFNSYIPCIFG